MAVDIANTAVPRGKIYLARNRGEQIPDSWAMDSEGNITTDPNEAINGVFLPMAGHKGYAITFMMDVLSGALTGSNTATRVGGPYEADKPSGAGHLFIAISVEAMGDTDDYLASVGQLINDVKPTPRAPGNDEIYYPRANSKTAPPTPTSPPAASYYPTKPAQTSKPSVKNTESRRTSKSPCESHRHLRLPRRHPNSCHFFFESWSEAIRPIPRPGAVMRAPHTWRYVT